MILIVLPSSYRLADFMSDKTIFKQEILKDSGICNNCFRRTHEVEERRYPRQVENRPITGTVLLRERLVKDPTETIKVYPKWDEAAHHPPGRNACKCGAVSKSVQMRPISKRDAIEYTERISERLEERSVIHNKDVLFGHVRRETSKEDRQHEDDEIFEEAVSKAVSRAHAEEATA